VLASQAVVSLPKLKTHAFQRLTGSVKNQFGCIPGLRKSEFHVRLPDAERFARMLVDLTRLVAPRLYLMDGVGAMEGNGPRGGRPRYLGLLLFSADPVALDAVVCRLLAIPAERVPTLQAGAEAGLGSWRPEEIRLLGDPLESFRPPGGFDADRSPLRPPRGGPLQRLLAEQLVARPRVDGARCIRCGLCIQMCPTEPKSVAWPEGDTARPPVHLDQTCIRCYCCQEICPAHAIRAVKPPLRRLLERLPRPRSAAR
jgi:ferredoxin